MKAKYVIESINFQRGRDPKTSIGISKFAKLIMGLSEFFTHILPSFHLSFNNIPSQNLDETPHKFIVAVSPIRKDGKEVTMKDYSTIKDMVAGFAWETSDLMTGCGFFPMGRKFSPNRKIFNGGISINITLSYDEMSDKNLD